MSNAQASAPEAHINTAAALELLGGDMELYHDLLKDYIAALPADINDVYTLEQADADAAARLVHRIKGSSLQAGAEALGAAGQALEDALRHRTCVSLTALTDAFVAEYTATVEEARRLMTAMEMPHV